MLPRNGSTQRARSAKARGQVDPLLGRGASVHKHRASTLLDDVEQSIWHDADDRISRSSGAIARCRLLISGAAGLSTRLVPN